jgi:hypothetical protein
LLPVRLFTTLLVWIVLVFGPVATTAATATAATFLASALCGPIAWQALFHGSECWILAWWPLLLLRLLLTILLRLALALFLGAVASLIAAVAIYILARATALLVALVALGAAFGTTVPVIASC